MKRPSTVTYFLYWILCSIVAAQNCNGSTPALFHLGVILDLETLVGKISRTSIQLAMDDFYANHANYSTRLMLHYRNSNSDDVQATIAALDLLRNIKTEVIIGPQKSSQAIMVSEIGKKSHVPVVSFSATSPTLSPMHIPYFIRTTINDSAQVNTITALVKAYNWRQIVPIYEDTDFGRDIIPSLTDALEEINVRVPYRSILPASSTDDQIKQELYKLQTMQTRVFIVHMSSSIGSTLFLKAKEVGMMSEGYVWIMTNGITNMIQSMNRSVVSAMRGALGVRLYVPMTAELNNFTIRWRKRFHEDNAEYMSNEPSIYALWAYDTIYALAMAVEKVGLQNNKIQNSTGSQSLPLFSHGSQLLHAIYNIKFRGLSGNFEITKGQLHYYAFEIFNIVAQGINDVGYWRRKQGLSKNLYENNNKNYSTSPEDLNPVIWPGESVLVPKGWEIPVSGRKLRVGVRVSLQPEFMDVKIDPKTNETRASGYSVDVFEAAVKRLSYAVPYEYKLFGEGYHYSSLTYDDFVHQVYLGIFDAVIGDITIRYNRTKDADFSIPYTESGVAMVVKLKEANNKKTFIFLQPLTIPLWLVSIGAFVAAGITILMLESKIRGIRSSISRHVATVVQLSLFAYQENLESILSWIVATVTSVFVLLILTSSYTASLSSMLMLQQLQPTVTDIYDLKKNGDYVGYKKGSFMEGLLEELGFDRYKLRGYYPNEFAEALDRGSANGVAAIVQEIPYIKLFLAKNCKSYTMVGPIYKTAGFGFAFPKGSPLVPDITQAILNITDGDDIIHIEKKWIGDQNCPNNGGISNQSNRLGILSFWGLFAFLGVVFITSLLISKIISLYKKWRANNETSSSSSTNSSIHPDENSLTDEVDPTRPTEVEIVTVGNDEEEIQ